MGSQQASEFGSAVKGKSITITQALQWHLQSNHYPPVPATMIPICKAAINAVNKGKYDKQVRLPAGVRFQGSNHAPASEIVRSLHLDPFLTDQGEE